MTLPCAAESAKLDKAQAAYDRVQAVYAKQVEKVKEAKDAVEEAETPAETRAAKKNLAQAQAKKDKVKENKRGQKMRLLKAQERYDECVAEQPPGQT